MRYLYDSIDLVEEMLKEVASKADAPLHFTHMFSSATTTFCKNYDINHGFIAWFEIGFTYRNVLFRDNILSINHHVFNIADPNMVDSMAGLLKICAKHGKEICYGCSNA